MIEGGYLCEAIRCPPLDRYAQVTEQCIEAFLIQGSNLRGWHVTNSDSYNYELFSLIRTILGMKIFDEIINSYRVGHYSTLAPLKSQMPVAKRFGKISPKLLF